jgi:membrane dipeptidase
MRIFDGHCDVLYKMWMDKTISFKDSSKLHVNLNYLSHYYKNVQCFALYIPEHVKFEQRFAVCLEMIDIFYTKIIQPYEEIKFIKTKDDIYSLKDNEIGAVLTLEGCDAIGNDLSKLSILFNLGVSSVGLTWNYANLVADGVLESRGAGLTNFGKKVIRRNNEYKVWTDISHLSEKSFWDTMELAKYPIASHSNAHSIFEHPRNLKDEQIKVLIEKDGLIGLTFVPSFLSDQNEAATIDKLLKHVEHVCSIGGQNHIGFGSDFDGIDKPIKGIENYFNYGRLIDALLKRYNEDLVKGFCFDNFVSKFPK